MDLRDIMLEPTGVKRPEHPDFWILSETILALKADTEEFKNGQIDQAEGERRWKAHYEKVGDFDSIAYCATQAALEINGIENGSQWMVFMANPERHQAFVGSVQAYFDGFIMGAMLERKKRPADDMILRAARDLWDIDDEGAHYDDKDRERLRAQLDAREGE